MAGEIREAGRAGSEAAWCRLLRARGEEVAVGESVGGRRCYGGVAEKVARRLATQGCWDERVEDGVPTEIQPLHMSAVREALGALIRERLQRAVAPLLEEAAVAPDQQDALLQRCLEGAPASASSSSRTLKIARHSTRAEPIPLSTRILRLA